MSSGKVLTGATKRKEVGRLLRLLEEGEGGSSKERPQPLEILTQLKLYGRDPDGAEPIFCIEGISILASYAFVGYTASSREALRCIANALLLAPNLRQAFIDLELLEKAAERYRSEDYDDQFLVSRIILLLTYGTNLKRDELLRNMSVASSINAHLIHHAQIYETNEQNGTANPIANMALSETLKLLFNLSVHQDNAIMFQPSIKPILSLLSSVNLPSRSLDPPISLLVNALVNLDFGHAEPSESTDSPSPSQTSIQILVEKLTEILGTSLKSKKPEELETSLPPLLVVLRKCYDIASEELRLHMQEALLPIHEERDVPIGKSDTLPSRLLHLSSSAMAPNLREIIPALMFELSDQDPKKFIENIGYGFAAGFLASHNIAVPGSTEQTQGRPVNGTDGPPINPITGQRLDKEPEDTGPPMTMEEKEREAERLFVLFQRLGATGVVNVQNPVHQAMNDGKLSRFEEVEDSD
jgi:Guanine nucleotide exchange factor synembryn